MIAATTTESAATRDKSRQWRTRPALSVALTAVAALVPVAASVVVTRIAAHLVPRPRTIVAAIGWWVFILALATFVVFLVARVTRRLAPLAALLKLSLVFPDHAPSRFGVAMRSGTVRQLQDRYTAVKKNGLGSSPAEAAQKLVELIGALNAHDRITRGHCERVRAYTALIAQELKLPADQVDKLRWAGLLHDLGKLEVPGKILNKKGKLNDWEWEVIKGHPAAGARIAAPLAEWLGDAFRAIGEHHERWDGAGYPNGVAGEAISIGGRIVAVADAFDVMTAARSYKRPSAPSWARTELVRCSGSQFDPVVVRAFLNVSIGGLRWAMGPLSWLAQLPTLAQGPIASASSTAATTAIAAAVAVGGSTAAGLLPAVAEPNPSVATTATTATNGQPGPLFVVDPVTGNTVMVTTTPTTAAGSAPTSTAPGGDPVTTPATTVGGAPATTVATTTPPNIIITVTAPPKTVPPNRAPVAVDDSQTMSGGVTVVNVNVLANDSDPDRDLVSIVSFTQPVDAPGSVSLQGDRLRYAPPTAQSATFAYTISDGHGHTATATVTITAA
jgi:putative nucleotidyltransferase with HDIG domain